MTSLIYLKSNTLRRHGQHRSVDNNYELRSKLKLFLL